MLEYFVVNAIRKKQDAFTYLTSLVILAIIEVDKKLNPKIVVIITLKFLELIW